MHVQRPCGTKYSECVWQKGGLAGAQATQEERGAEGRAASCGLLTSKRGLDLNLRAAVGAGGGADGFKVGRGAHTLAAGALQGPGRERPAVPQAGGRAAEGSRRAVGRFAPPGRGCQRTERESGLGLEVTSRR